MNRYFAPVMQSSRIGMIQGCCDLLDGLLAVADLASSPEQLAMELERLFIYALTWSVGGLLEDNDRAKFTEYICNLTTVGLPTFTTEGDTLYEYRVNPDSMEWERWKAPEWEYPVDVAEPNFANMLVPTIESARVGFIIEQLQKRKKGVLMTGSSGTAKSSIAAMFFANNMSESMKVKTICFSSATTPAGFQVALEMELDKRSGKTFGPPAVPK